MFYIRQMIIIALTVVFIEVHAQGIKTFQKEWVFQEKEIILSRDQTALEVTNMNDSRFLYSLCEDAHRQSKKICDVMVETYTSENLTYKSTCKLHLQAEKESRMIGRNFMLTHLGIDKVVFMWLEREKSDWVEHAVYFCVRVIDLSNCEYYDVKFSIDVQQDMVDEIIFNNIVVYESSFDVFFHSKSSCETGRCKATFDAKGKSVSNVESFLPKDDTPTLSLIFSANSSSLKGYFDISWISGKLASKFVGADGETKDLINTHIRGYITFAASNKYDILGLCWLPARGDSKINCTQINSHLKLELNVTLSFGYKISFIRMHNLPQGGFLLLQSVCTDHDCLGYHTFYISRVYADGHHDNRPLEITGIEFDATILDRYRINLYEKNNDEFCVSVIGPTTLNEYDIIVERPRLTYVSKCFHKKYVSVK